MKENEQRKTNSQSRKFGFTLIEVLTVIAIIGILAAIGVPFFNNYRQSLNLSNAATRLTGELRLAQQRAISEQQKYSVQFDLTLNAYDLIKESDGSLVEIITLPTPLTLTNLTGFNNTTRATFNPVGAVDNDGSITIQDNSGNGLVIQVQPAGFITQTKL